MKIDLIGGIFESEIIDTPRFVRETGHPSTPEETESNIYQVPF